MATLILLAVGGHFGSAITHGRDFLTRDAPAPLRALLGGPSHPREARQVPADPMQRQLFTDVVQPILQRRCAPCHGPEKQKGELRMDSYEALLRGGKSGPAITPGDAAKSLSIKRLLLPLEHDDHMPPEGKPQPTPAEIGLLQWWINVGAPEDGTVGSYQPGSDVLRMLGMLAVEN